MKSNSVDFGVIKNAIAVAVFVFGIGMAYGSYDDNQRFHTERFERVEAHSKEQDKEIKKLDLARQKADLERDRMKGDFIHIKKQLEQILGALDEGRKD